LSVEKNHPSYVIDNIILSRNLLSLELEKCPVIEYFDLNDKYLTLRL